MIDREKVIKGLQEAVDWLSTETSLTVVDQWVVRDALALLKAQEPRVMTLGQVRDEADHMYLEKHSKTGSDLYGCAIRGDWDGYGIELLMSEYDTARERWSDYGKMWRCWTSRPTDEQREATPWNAQK